jgi:hypothetical protein
MAMKMAVESMEILPGHFPVPAGSRNRDFCPPKLGFDVTAAVELFWRIRGYF